MTIGERLEEARKRKGVSVREAAEATKIRGEYLQAFESGSFDISLPEIYVRGFLRNYARYLRLDPEKVMTDFEARRRGKGQLTAAAASRESMGRVEIPQEDPMAESPYTGRPRRQNAAEADNQPETTQAPSAKGAGGRDIDWTLWAKVGAVAVLGLLLISGVGLGLYFAFRPSSLPETTERPAPRDLSAPPVIDVPTVVLRASQSVSVTVIDLANDVILFEGLLQSGQSTPAISYTGPVELRWSRGEALLLDRDGQLTSIPSTGPGRTIIRPPR